MMCGTYSLIITCNINISLLKKSLFIEMTQLCVIIAVNTKCWTFRFFVLKRIIFYFQQNLNNFFILTQKLFDYSKVKFNWKISIIIFFYFYLGYYLNMSFHNLVWILSFDVKMVLTSNFKNNLWPLWEFILFNYLFTSI